jgi:hypothetical protein
MLHPAAVRIQTGRVFIEGDLTVPEQVIELNRAAMRRMRAPVQLEIVPGATHLFEQPGALESVSRLALTWCTKHLKGSHT